MTNRGLNGQTQERTHHVVFQFIASLHFRASFSNIHKHHAVSLFSTHTVVIGQLRTTKMGRNGKRRCAIVKRMHYNEDKWRNSDRDCRKRRADLKSCPNMFSFARLHQFCLTLLVPVALTYIFRCDSSKKRRYRNRRFRSLLVMFEFQRH